jgi:hypothetical protein
MYDEKRFYNTCSIPNEATRFFMLSDPSSHIMALGLTQPLTELSTRNLPVGKGWPACKSDLTPLWASTA